MARERVVLIDGSSLIYRAFFAIPSTFQTSAGLPTNAIYGFAVMFQKVLGGRRPALGAVIFDAPGKTFRDDKFPAYKAQRPKMAPELREQIPWIHRLVKAHDFPNLTVEGYEADDVIGTLTRLAREAGHEVHIISADKDFTQLIDEDVRMVDTMRDITYDAELVRKKWGVPPKQIVDLFALMGDSSDNVPGVPGIGQKTAASLLERFGSLDGVYEAIDELKGKQKERLEENREQAYLSRDLVQIELEAELPFGLEGLSIEEVDRAKVDALYRELEFYSLLSEQGAPEVEPEDADFGALEDLQAAKAFFADLDEGEVAVYALVDPPHPVSGRLLGLAFATGEGHARYLPIEGEGGLGEAALEAARAWLEDASKPKVVHDARDLYTALACRGVRARGVGFDLQLASFLIDPTKIIPHRLDQVARELLHRPLPSEKDLLGKGKSQRALAEVPLAELAAHACHLAAAIHEASPEAKARLEAEGQRRFLDEIELPLSFVLGEMQRVGVRVDGEALAVIGEGFEARKAEVEARIYELAGREFNIGSTKQLATVLFEELGLPVIKRTKTGYSTDSEVLERLSADGHAIARQIVDQRALAKLINTYTRALEEAVNPETGRVHCTFQQTSGASGRLITTDPDLQRTPIRTEDGKRIREAFLPREGALMLSADWSQIELRILAHVSEDPLLMEAFRDGVDVHRRTASQLFDITPQEVTASQRNIGKTVNFATIYGQGATALAQSLGIQRSEAKAYIDRYFERYAGVREWLDATIAGAHERGYVETLEGRRRYVPELSSRTPAERAYGERIAANTPIQGSAADICKLAMLRIAEDLASRGLEATMLLQIHDELLFEVPPEELDEVKALVTERMEHAADLRVPLVVDVGHGGSWAEAH